jgi:excisionase family DNA binding protein
MVEELMVGESQSEVHARDLPDGLHLLRVREVAAILNMSPITVRRRVRDNVLPHFRIKGQLYFKLNEIRAFIQASRGG